MVKFKDFSRPLSVFPILFKANLISRPFQDSSVYSSTFQACVNPAFLISSRAINCLMALQALKLYTYHQQHSFLPLVEEGVVVLLPQVLEVVEGVVLELAGVVVAEVVGTLTPTLLLPLLLPLPHLVLKR